MSRETEVRVDNLQHDMRMIIAALNAVVERLEALETMQQVDGNAVVEGDDVTTGPRNGKIRKTHR
jgi:hypothetical protein